MKKLLFVSLLVLMLSCKKEAAPIPTEESINLTEVAPNDTQLIATWQLVEQKVDGIVQPIQTNSEITFYNNNTYKGYNNQTYKFEIIKDTLLLYNSAATKPEKTQLFYLDESKDFIQLTTKISDGRVVQTQLRRKSTN